MAKTRQARIDEEVKRALSEIIAGEVKDDRLSPMTSVTKVQVTNDLQLAKVYLSVLGDEKERQRTMAALKHASGFIRSRLARKTSLRHAPEFTFVFDDSLEHGLHIAQLLEDVGASRTGADSAPDASDPAALESAGHDSAGGDQVKE